VFQDWVTSDDGPEIEAAAEWASEEKVLPEDAEPPGGESTGGPEAPAGAQADPAAGIADPQFDEMVPTDEARDQNGTAAPAVVSWAPAAPPTDNGDPAAGTGASGERPELTSPDGSLAEETVQDELEGGDENQAAQYASGVDPLPQPPQEGEEDGNGDEETLEITPPDAFATPPNESAPQDGLPSRLPDRGPAGEDGDGSPEAERAEPEKPENGVALAERGERGVEEPSEAGRSGGESPNARPRKPPEAAGGAQTSTGTGSSAGDEELRVMGTADETRTGTRTAVRGTITSGMRAGSATLGSWEPPRSVAARAAAQRAREVRALARQTADRDGGEESLTHGRRATPSTSHRQVTRGSHRLVAEGGSATSSVQQASVSDTGEVEATVRSVQASSGKRGGR